ncbi:MAG: type II secretion system F family protein [Bryobacteraceae bacterium]
MSIYLILAFFLTLMVAIAVFGYQRYARPGRVFEQLGNPVLPSGVVTDRAPKVREYKLIEKMGELLPVSEDDSSLTKKQLSFAGYRSDHAVRIFYGIRVLATIVLGVMGILLRAKVSDNPAMHFIFPAACALGGYIGPSFILDKRITKRQTILRLSLPDALDLMVIAVEAGLGLDQAIQYVTSELRIAHPELTEEFSLVSLEIRAGKRRVEALKNLTDRTGEDELGKLVAILIQNDRFGTSIADSLRNHSDFMRVRRRQEAEERAGKVGVKLVFPIFFFILPAMMLVCAGPAVIGVVKYLIPLMKGAM